MIILLLRRFRDVGFVVGRFRILRLVYSGVLLVFVFGRFHVSLLGLFWLLF